MACQCETPPSAYETRRPDAATTVHVIGVNEPSRECLRFALAREAFRAAAFADALAFERAHAGTERCDIVVIDSARDLDLALVRSLRERHPSLGIGVVAAAGNVEARVRSLESEADAHLVEPVDARELAAQLRALQRRLPRAPHPLAPTGGAWLLQQDGWILQDPHGNAMRLTTAERAFIGCLIAGRGAPVSRDALIESLGDNPRDADPHRVDVLVNRLRRKAATFGMTLPLHAVRARGYMLAGGADAAPVAHERVRVAASTDAAMRDLAPGAPPPAPRRSH